MDFARPITTRELSSKEKDELRDFVTRHTKYESDTAALTQLFKEADALTVHDNVSQVIDLMEYHLESSKKIETIKGELEELETSVSEKWGMLREGLLRDEVAQLDWGKAISLLRAKHKNPKVYSSLIDLFHSKDDTPNQAASKIELLVDNDLLDGNFVLRYDDLSKALTVKAAAIGLNPTVAEIPPTTQEVLHSYLIFSLLQKKQSTGLGDFQEKVETLKKEHSPEIKSVGNLLYWMMRDFLKEGPRDLHQGRGIITLDQLMERR